MADYEVYNWIDSYAGPMLLHDERSRRERLLGHRNPDAYNESRDIDDCYTDDVIPTRPRNRMRRMVRLYGGV